MKVLEFCPVCTAADVSLLYCARTVRASTRWQIYGCRTCTHRFVNPQPSWSELDAYYREDYDAYSPSHGAAGSDEQVIENAKLMGKFRHVHVWQGARILDVGCGGGYFLGIASRLGAQVEGVELNQAGVEQARKSGLRVFHGATEQYRQVHRDKRFDLVTANHVLEHIHDPVAELASMKQLLAKDGTIWISVPNGHYWASLALRERWHSTDIPRHLHQFTPQSLTKCAILAGLRVEALETFSLPKAVAGTIRQWLRYRLFVPQRLTRFLRPIDWAAARLGARLDSKASGEALLIWLKPS